MKDTPRSRVVPRAEIQEIVVTPGTFQRVVLRAGKTHTLHCWQDEATVRASFAPLQP